MVNFKNDDTGQSRYRVFFIEKIIDMTKKLFLLAILIPIVTQQTFSQSKKGKSGSNGSRKFAQSDDRPG